MTGIIVLGEPETSVLDPGYQWIDVRRLGDPCAVYIRGLCLHKTVIPVDSVVTGEIVAHICATCDEQLP